MEQKGLDFGDRPAPARAPAARRTLSVAELTERLRGVIETEFFDVWVQGEVSNFTIAASGHWYFSLKDDRAQLRAVVWKTAARFVRFRPRDGARVVVRGGLRVYGPKGEYQLAVELIEPLGKGALQQAFEELKERLEKEGLFDPARKRPLPMLPRRIGVVTSPDGAAIQDMLRVLSSRYANLEVLLYPARVQGAEAAAEIVRGIRVLNRLGGLDVLVVTRGGGSLEDLWCFNEEAVARALAASQIPTIAAIGHETDFTIADFVADLRAATPSAAAERVVQAKVELGARIEALERRLQAANGLRMTRLRARVAAVTSHRVFEAERGRLRGHAQRLQALAQRADSGLLRRLERCREQLRRCSERAEAYRWDRQIAARKERLARQRERLDGALRGGLEARRAALARWAGKLDSLSPLSVLARGYALVWSAEGRLVRAPDEVQLGAGVRIRVHGGSLEATVTRKETP